MALALAYGRFSLGISLITKLGNIVCEIERAPWAVSRLYCVVPRIWF